MMIEHEYTVHKLFHCRRMYTNTNPCRSQAVWYSIDLQTALLDFMYITIHESDIQSNSQMRSVPC